MATVIVYGFWSFAAFPPLGRPRGLWSFGLICVALSLSSPAAAAAIHTKSISKDAKLLTAGHKLVTVQTCDKTY